MILFYMYFLLLRLVLCVCAFFFSLLPVGVGERELTEEEEEEAQPEGGGSQKVYIYIYYDTMPMCLRYIRVWIKYSFVPPSVAHTHISTKNKIESNLLAAPVLFSCRPPPLLFPVSTSTWW